MIYLCRHGEFPFVTKDKSSLADMDFLFFGGGLSHFWVTYLSCLPSMILLSVKINSFLHRYIKFASKFKSSLWLILHELILLPTRALSKFSRWTIPLSQNILNFKTLLYLLLNLCLPLLVELRCALSAEMTNFLYRACIYVGSVERLFLFRRRSHYIGHFENASDFLAMLGFYPRSINTFEV